MQDEFLTEAQGERIAKRLSRLGVCSRRDAEKLIAEGRVKVDGEVLDTPAIKVLPDQKIEVDGKEVKEEEVTRVWMIYKPLGVITTNKDPGGRPTVFSLLPKDMPRTITIGRLDLNSEGLLLLTNNGEVARHMELPETGWVRRYRVRVRGTPTAESIRQLKKGMTVEGVHYGSVSVQIEKTPERKSSNCWLIVSLAEGKNREIRKLFDALGHSVNRLIRVSYGPFQLGSLQQGELKEIPKRVLKSQLGKKFF